MSGQTGNWLKALIDHVRSKAHARSQALDEPFSSASDPPTDAHAAYHMSTKGLLIRGFEPLNPYQSPPRQHPLATEKDPPPLDWERWSSMARENQRRGWSFARYAAGGPTGNMACLFGIVRGPFGSAKMDFYICAPGYSTGTFHTLNAITHLPSGVGCGLFTDQHSAATAGEIAALLADDWEMFELHHDTARSREAILHMHQARVAAGIVKCATHARTNANPDSASLPIWTQDYSNTVMVRPEGKLS